MATSPDRARTTRVLRATRLAAVVLVAALAIAIAVQVGRGELSVASLRASAQQFGPAAPLAFVAIIAVTMPLLIPTTPFVLAAGLLFGPWTGTLVAVVGQAIGVLASYSLGQAMGVGAIQARFGPRVQHFVEWARRRGTWGIAAMQATPLVPRKLLNYALPAAGFRRRQVAAGALIGFAPLTFLVVLTGDALFTVDALRRLFTHESVAAILVVGVMVFAWRVRVKVRLRPE